MLGLGLAALPQKLLAEAVGLLIEIALVAGIAYHYTAKHYELKEAADLAQAQAAAAAQYAALNQKYQSAEVQLTNSQAHTNVVHDTVVKEIPTIIDHMVYRNDCIDADGLRLIQAALSNSLPASAPAGIAHAAMPTASAASGNDGR